jgi:hypothetical protein
MRVVSAVLAMLIALSFAGCVDGEDAPADNLETGLLSGKGAMTGLLVDDRFRPLQVGPGALQGTILIQETGGDLLSNDNGEFSSGALEPGRYTLRIQVEGHEAVPQTFTVQAGEITETTVIARRTVSTDDVVLQVEFSIFIPCTLAFVVSPMQWDCVPDLSGETTRFSFRMTDPELQAGATFLLTEVLLNREAGEAMQGTYMMQVEGQSQDGVTSYNYVSKFIEEVRYDRVLLERGVNNEFQQDPLLNYGVWEDTEWINWRFWGQGFFRKELNDAGVPATYGVGLQTGTKATVLASMFFTTDRSFPEGFCGLCGNLT